MTERTLDDAAAAVVDAAMEGGPVEPEAYKVASRTLRRYVERLGARSVDADEVATDVLSELFVNPPSSVEHPTAFLMWKARNRLYDRARASKRRPETPNESLGGDGYYSDDDDAIARLLERQATAAELEDALRAANAAGDSMASDVALAWVKQAKVTGAAPSDREVARILGVSHPTVGKALSRLRHYILTTRRLDNVL